MSFSFLLRRDGTTNPDYQIRAGRIVLSSGPDAARDRIFTALSTDVGEWFLDVTKGIPYTGENGILGGKRSEAEVGALYRRRILLCPEVGRVNSLEINQDAMRHVDIQSEVKLDMADGSSETIQVSN
jgi:hypothetical protein